MKNETMQGYQQLYNKLVKDYIGAEEPTPQRLVNALTAKAREGCSKSYWYRVKTAVMAVQETQGYDKAVERVKGAKFPKDGVDQRKAFAKRVKEDDYIKLMKASDDPVVKSALFIAKYTGMRPEEMHHATIDPDTGVIKVSGAKKSEKLKRGADRSIQIDMELAKTMAAALSHVRTESKEVIANRVSRLTRRVFPRRKAPPTLKSFRHQLGSELKALVKAGQMDVKDAAYMLGHQSADSMDRYGNIKMSGESAVRIQPASETMEPRTAVRTPSAEVKALAAELQAEIMQIESSGTPAEKMELAERREQGINNFAQARKNLTEQKADKSNEKTRSASQNRNLAASDGVDLSL